MDLYDRLSIPKWSIDNETIMNCKYIFKLNKVRSICPQKVRIVNKQRGTTTKSDLVEKQLNIQHKVNDGHSHNIPL